MATQHYNLPTWEESTPLQIVTPMTNAMETIDSELYSLNADVMVNTASIEQAEGNISGIQAKEDSWDRAAQVASEEWQVITGTRLLTITSSISSTSMRSTLNKWIFRIGCTIPEIASNTNLWTINGQKIYIPLLKYTNQAENFGFNFNGSSLSEGNLSSAILNFGYSTGVAKYFPLIAASDGTSVYILATFSGNFPVSATSLAWECYYVPTGISIPI